ncbi:MAG: hypothetical protein WCU00_07205, partial [Candidatus Latescibacterota bacterium]
MKKFILPFLLMIAVTSAYSAPFSPQTLTISSQPSVQYNFDGSTLNIPMTVNGKAAYTIFLVYTTGKGSDIGTFRNGMLGWHYVNKVDTCVYLRADGVHETGTSNMVWDGKDSYGTKLPKGTYTYYLWGYDSQSVKAPAMKSLHITKEEEGPLAIEDTDASGNKLANPFIYGCNEINYAAKATVPLTTYKWRVGTDPETLAADLEWTTSEQGGGIHRTGSSITIDRLDHSMFYVGEMGTDYATYVTKYKWVPGGAATLQTDWGDNGTYHWTTEKVPGWMPMTGVIGDGNDLLFMSYMNQIDSNPFSQVLFVNREDGSKIKTVDLSMWFCSKADADAGGQMNGGPTDFGFADGQLTMAGNYWCTVLALDPTRDAGDEVAWINKNGDYIHDKDFLPDAAIKWACNDFKTPPWTDCFKTDPMGFNIFCVNGVGTASFGLVGPGGQGVGYFTTASAKGNQNGNLPLNVGSAYDGIYTGNSEAALPGIYYLAYDAFKGVISDGVGVADAAPAAFSVTQNTPNPFNPTTTISFNLAKAGKVTVDVFNISGQKVDTLVNTTMSAGSHSVTWNASKHS